MDNHGIDLLKLYYEEDNVRAFQALVGMHIDMVYGVCSRKLSNHHDAKKAVEITFALLAANTQSITHNLISWLHATARTQATKLLRNYAKDEHLQQWQHIFDKNTEYCWDEAISEIDECIDMLPPEERELLIDYFWGGKTHMELTVLYEKSQPELQEIVKQACDRTRFFLCQKNIPVSSEDVLDFLTRTTEQSAPSELHDQASLFSCLRIILNRRTHEKGPEKSITLRTIEFCWHNKCKLVVSLTATIILAYILL